MLVELNIIKLKKMQKEMDAEAAKVHGLDMNSRKWFENRIMAIIGELYETMAVVEDFKDWKKNKGKADDKYFTSVKSIDDGIENEIKVYCMNHDVFQPLSPSQAIHLSLVEECSDVLHFMLTLINVAQIKNIESFNLMSGEPTELLKRAIRRLLELEDAYILNNLRTSEMSVDLTENVFCIVMSYFEALGVTQEELEQAYHEKHKVNHKRLETGY